MTYSVTDVIDSIVTDLQAQRVALGLPAFDVQKYVQPLWESAEMLKPLLAVFAVGSDPMVLATDGSYTLPDHIRIGWFVPVPESLETLFVDPAKAKIAIQSSEKVRNRVATYFAKVPGYLPQTEATITKCRLGKTRGGTYGIEMDILITSYGVLGSY